MTRDQTVLLAVGGLAAVCLVLLVALLVSLRKVRAADRATAAELASLRQRLDDLEHERPPPASAAPVTAPAEFVITDLGQGHAALGDVPEPALPDGPAFADIVLKETVVKAASLAHGVRRGLAPATRNRIRFEMKQEVRRARKQRRADLKATQRDLHSRQRARQKAQHEAMLRVDPGEAS